MNVAGIRRGMVAGVLLAVTMACGHKGPPVPPDHPLPPAVNGFGIERTGADVTLHFTVPDRPGDDHAGRLFERVDVFALTKAASQPSPLPMELVSSTHQLAAVNAPVKAKTTGEEAPAESVALLTFKEALTTDGAAAEPMVRYYAVQAVNGRRRGPLSPILKLPLDMSPQVPTQVTANYDERVLSLTWSGGQASQRYVVDETDAAGASPQRVTPAPVEASKFETPFEFGKARCFVVRAVQGTADVTIIGAPAAPVCVTPVDRFAPAAPSDLVALAGDKGVDVSWTASTATDVAGYLVLRAEGANGTLQPLTLRPVAAVTYQDTTAQSGVTYQYAAKAVDGAGNESAVSNRYTVTARGLVRRTP